MACNPPTKSGCTQQALRPNLASHLCSCQPLPSLTYYLSLSAVMCVILCSLPKHRAEWHNPRGSLRAAENIDVTQ